MKCLTICQPYATLIVTPQELLPVGQVHKRIENRKWPTRFRGMLLIHAGKSKLWFDGYEDIFPGVPFGAIIGTAVVSDCLPIDECRQKYDWAAQHIHAEGPWCWVLEDPVKFDEPVPYSGQLGLFDVDWRSLPISL